MTAMPTQEDLAAILRDLKKTGGIQPLAAIVTRGVRTLYRHAETGGGPVEMDPTTYRELSTLFAELGLLEGYGLKEMAAAVAEIQRRAKAAGVNGRGAAAKAARVARSKAARRRGRKRASGEGDVE